ncbi:MAG: hypothetical protein EBX50_01425 [Chitinophagia bacterium]|jgi:hypothetical protein|nr:hypothetical protein [Chitinophagia bacterium]
MINNTSDLVKIVRSSIIKILNANSIDPSTTYILLGGQNDPLEKKDHTILITPIGIRSQISPKIVNNTLPGGKLTNHSEQMFEQILQIDVFGTTKTRNAHDLGARIKAGFDHDVIGLDIKNAGVEVFITRNMVQRHELLSQATYEQISTFEIVLMYNIVVNFGDIGIIDDVLCNESEIHFI